MLLVCGVNRRYQLVGVREVGRARLPIVEQRQSLENPVFVLQNLALLVLCLTFTARTTRDDLPVQRLLSIEHLATQTRIRIKGLFAADLESLVVARVCFHVIFQLGSVGGRARFALFGSEERG